MLSNSAKELWELDRKHHLHPWQHFDSFREEGALLIDRAAGCYIYGAEKGERYFDAVGGLWCTQIGQGRQEMADAIAGKPQNAASNSQRGALWAGTWQAAGSEECKELRCHARPVGRANWEATFTGVCSRRFSFNVSMKGRESGGKITFKGKTDLGETNGGVYVWSGEIVGKEFTGSYTSAGGKRGTFLMQPMRAAEVDSATQPDR